MFFVIPEMPSKTFVMVEKKLPDHFKLSVCSSRVAYPDGVDPSLKPDLNIENEPDPSPPPVFKYTLQ